MVSFSVHAEIKYGEKVHLSGDTFSLGGFKPSQSVELVTTPEEYPIWRTPKKIVLLTNKPVEYRYAIFSGGNFSAWEPLQCRSRRVVPHTSTMDIIDVFGVVGDGNGHSIAQEAFEQQQQQQHAVLHADTTDMASGGQLASGPPSAAVRSTSSGGTAPKMTSSASSSYLRMGLSPRGPGGPGAGGGGGAGWATTSVTQSSSSQQQQRHHHHHHHHQQPPALRSGSPITNSSSSGGGGDERTDAGGSIMSLHHRRPSGGGGSGNGRAMGLGNPPLTLHGYTPSPPQQMFYARGSSPPDTGHNDGSTMPPPTAAAAADAVSIHQRQAVASSLLPGAAAVAETVAAAAGGPTNVERVVGEGAGLDGSAVRPAPGASAAAAGAPDAALKSGSVLLVAFHLPVLLTCVDAATNQWTAEWDRDNPFSRSDGGSVADSNIVKWIGAISQHAIAGATQNLEQVSQSRAIVHVEGSNIALLFYFLSL
jgi:hypothetical protein